MCVRYAAFFLATGSSTIPMMSDSFMMRVVGAVPSWSLG